MMMENSTNTRCSRIATSAISGTGARVSRLGLGSASLGNLYRSMTDKTALETMGRASDGGITYFDTAPHYGQGLAERRIGRYLNESATDIVLSTKVGRVLRPIPESAPGTERFGFVDGDPFEPVFDYSYDGVMNAFYSSLQRLGVDQVDILLAHDLGKSTHGLDHDHHFKTFLNSGYSALAKLKAEGRVKAIGLGVNEWQICESVLIHADLDVVLLAGRYTLLEQTAIESFLPLCEKLNVSILAGGPFNSGILSGGSAYNYGPAPEQIKEKVKRLRAVCDAYDVPLAAAAIQFPLSHPNVVSVVAGMAESSEVDTNLALFEREIPASLWSDLKSEGLIHSAVPEPSPLGASS